MVGIPSVMQVDFRNVVLKPLAAERVRFEGPAGREADLQLQLYKKCEVEDWHNHLSHELISQL
jgi:hypothetical protein